MCVFLIELIVNLDKLENIDVKFGSTPVILLGIIYKWHVMWCLKMHGQGVNIVILWGLIPTIVIL